MSSRLRFFAMVASLAFLAASAQAAQKRIPQVTVSFNTLQSFFTSQGQAINVAFDQLAAQTFQGMNVGIPVPLTFEARPFVQNGQTMGTYNAQDASPALDTVLPAAVTPGWFASAGFRSGPNRLVVNLFDGASTLQSSVSYLNVDPFSVGLESQGNHGTFYSQDNRNADGLAHVLLYQGTGSHSGDVWMCVEDGLLGFGGGGDFNYADAIFLLTFFAPVPVEHTSWKDLKARFR